MYLCDMKDSQPIQEPHEFYDLHAVAKILHLSRMTIYRYVVSKKLPAYKFGRHYRIKKEDLEAFISHYKV